MLDPHVSGVSRNGPGECVSTMVGRDETSFLGGRMYVLLRLWTNKVTEEFSEGLCIGQFWLPGISSRLGWVDSSVCKSLSTSKRTPEHLLCPLDPGSGGVTSGTP